MNRTNFQGTLPFLATLAVLALLAATAIGLSRQKDQNGPRATGHDLHVSGDAFHPEAASWDALDAGWILGRH